MEPGFSFANIKHWIKYSDGIMIAITILVVYILVMLVTRTIDITNIITTEGLTNNLIGQLMFNLVYTGVLYIYFKYTIKTKAKPKNFIWSLVSPYILSLDDFNIIHTTHTVFPELQNYKIISRWLDDHNIEYEQRRLIGRTKPFPQKEFFGIVFKNYDDMIYAKIGFSYDE